MKLNQEQKEKLVALVLSLNMDSEKIDSDVIEIIYKSALQSNSTQTLTLTADEIVSLKQIHDFLNSIEKTLT